MVRIDYHEYLSTEERRLKEDRDHTKYWKKWGPYVAERQWATGKFSGILHFEVQILTSIVREDYSADGDAWSRRFYCFARRCSSNTNYRKTFRMSTLARGLLGGGRMVLRVYLIHMDCKILRFLSGTKRSV
jgi:hypothetical protein